MWRGSRKKGKTGTLCVIWVCCREKMCTYVAHHCQRTWTNPNYTENVGCIACI